jgi:hypothetical protein
MYINCRDDLANRVEGQGSNDDVSSLLLAVSLESFQSSNTLSNRESEFLSYYKGYVCTHKDSMSVEY